MAIEWFAERRKIDDLKPHSKNPRRFTKKGLADLGKSIDKFGVADPVIVNKDNVIIGGHARIEYLKSTGESEIDVRVPERLLSEKEVEELLIRLNKNTAGEWDFDMLANLFEQDELLDWGFEKEEFGILDEEFVGLTDEDEVPSEPEKTVTKRGDIWLLGEHKLMCGDSTMMNDVEKLMNGAKADMVFTDPPYGISIVRNNKVGGGSNSRTTSLISNDPIPAKAYSPVLNDDTTDTARDFYNTCVGYGFEDFIIWGGNYFTDFLERSMCWLVWDKENGETKFADIELAWCSNNSAARLYRWLWNGASRKGDHKTEGSTRVHPTQKPVGLFVDIFKDFEFRSCYDGFGGSGSTLIACEKTNRKCFMMELDEKYCDVIINRWQNYAGKKATLESTGQTYNELRETKG
jgi:DNA modification methylase